MRELGWPPLASFVEKILRRGTTGDHLFAPDTNMGTGGNSEVKPGARRATADGTWITPGRVKSLSPCETLGRRASRNCLPFIKKAFEKSKAFFCSMFCESGNTKRNTEQGTRNAEQLNSSNPAGVSSPLPRWTFRIRHSLRILTIVNKKSPRSFEGFEF
jgi:hypothetical protein